MPHYVTKPNQKSLKYYIFSTIVMAPITPKMYRTEMIEYLKANGYEKFWLNLDADSDPKIYWNGDFWFVTEEDNYFV